MFLPFCYRYPGASATAYAWNEQEDDRGLEGLLRIVGKGTNSPQHNQRSVYIYVYIHIRCCRSMGIYIQCKTLPAKSSNKAPWPVL